MIALICLCFALVVLAFYMTSQATSGIEERQSSLDVLAQQMVYYHAASMRTCGNDCTGVIDNTGELSTFRRGNGEFASGNLRSAVSGNYVFTYYVSPDTVAAEREQDHAGVLAAIVDARDWDTQTFIGRYDASTGSLRSTSTAHWINPETSEMTKTVLPEFDFSASGLPNGVPMLVNRR